MNEENITKFQRLGEIYKSFWNLRGSEEELMKKIEKEFQKQDIEMFILYLIERIGKDRNDFSRVSNNFMLSSISENPSIVFSDLDFTNSSLIKGCRFIFESIEIESFDSLPISDEKSYLSAINVLLIILMNENKEQMKKDIIKVTHSTYFSVLISAARLFFPEKYQQVQMLFKKNYPFSSLIHQVPVTEKHLAMALFTDYFMEQMDGNNRFISLLFLFAIFQITFIDSLDIKFILTDSILSYTFSSFLNVYMSRPSYKLALILLNFKEKKINERNIIKFENLKLIRDKIFLEKNDDFYTFDTSKQLDLPKDNNENILSFYYDDSKNKIEHTISFNSEIIQDPMPNGFFPTYNSVIDFLNAKPESISMDTLIEDALNYPSLIREIASIFMAKLRERDYENLVILSKQILKRCDDIRITWIEQRTFFPILMAIYECLNEVLNDYHFEVLFYLFISLYEGCSRQGDTNIITSLRKFISGMDEDFRIFLENFLNPVGEFLCKETDDDYDDGGNMQRPIKKLINFLRKCKNTNDIDTDEMIKYPYLFFGAFLWGVKTIHPNSQKLLTIKFPKYKILKRFFIYISSCHHVKSNSISVDVSSSMYTTCSSNCSYDLLTRFPPRDESYIRILIIQQLNEISQVETRIEQIQGIIISWRAWIEIFTIEKFILILIETLILCDDEEKINHVEGRNSFLYAEIILSSVFKSPSNYLFSSSFDNQAEFNPETNKFEIKNDIHTEINDVIDQKLKICLWTTLEFINNYDSTYENGLGFASFCLLLIISIRNEWKSEFKKVIDFGIKMMKESSWKSLKYSFGKNLLLISTSIIEVNDMIEIDQLDLDFLKINWTFGISFFYIKRIKESGLIKS